MSKSYSGYISAGGKGTRLLPVTSKIPKPLVMIHNKTLIELWVEQFSENQITDLYVSVEHMKEQIIEHLEELKQKYRVNITYIIEDEPMVDYEMADIPEALEEYDPLHIQDFDVPTFDMEEIEDLERLQAEENEARNDEQGE